MGMAGITITTWDHPITDHITDHITGHTGMVTGMDIAMAGFQEGTILQIILTEVMITDTELQGRPIVRQGMHLLQQPENQEIQMIRDSEAGQQVQLLQVL